MAEAGAWEVREVRAAGELPQWEVPGWREEFGVVAGVTGRGPWQGADFDLGLSTGGRVGEVQGRWRAFLGGQAGFCAAVLGHQVHGATVRRHEGPGEGWLQVRATDGHVTGRPGLLLLVTVADCVPVYLVEPETRTVGLLHAGWRGVAAGVLEAGLEALTEVQGAPVQNVVMHCGIAISGPCYEVGGEVVTAVTGRPADREREHLDLREVLVERALQAGVRRVTKSGLCTASDAGDFFSHRRSGGRDGRQVAYLGVPAPGAGVPPIL